MTTTPPAQARPFPPALVGLIRGVIIAVAVALLGALVQAITGANLLAHFPPELRPAVGIALVILIRTIEGAADTLRGQAPQAGPLGSAPAHPADYLARMPSAPLPYAVTEAVAGTAFPPADLEAIAVHASKRITAARTTSPAPKATTTKKVTGKKVPAKKAAAHKKPPAAP